MGVDDAAAPTDVAHAEQPGVRNGVAGATGRAHQRSGVGRDDRVASGTETEVPATRSKQQQSPEGRSGPGATRRTRSGSALNSHRANLLRVAARLR